LAGERSEPNQEGLESGLLAQDTLLHQSLQDIRRYQGSFRPHPRQVPCRRSVYSL
jgi:hypothetical protein